MSTTATTPAPAPEPAKTEATEAGNYFVANYPPFSCWTKEAVADAQLQLDEPAPADKKLGIYFHIPFCRKRCHFCYFRVYTDKNASEIREYLNAGIREMEILAQKPYLQGRKPQFIYFGGGTPSYLNPDQLALITDKMQEFWPWDEAEEIAFEAEPGTLTEKKLDAIRKIGVTRLSLGVESFDDHILELNGRAHRSGEIERAYKYARDIGFPQINIDLIAGMVEETEDNWKRGVEKALAMEPDCLTVYQMEVPYNTTIYKQMKEEGKLVAPVADWNTKRRWVDYCFSEFEKAGYTVNSTTTVVKNPQTTKFVYRDSLWSGADLMPLGVASFGRLGHYHVQNNADILPYQLQLGAGKLPWFRAYHTNPEEELIREFILPLKLGRLSTARFQEKFGVNVLEKFSGHLGWMVSEGFANISGDTITLTREGLLQVDRLLHGFFLPEHNTVRYT